ncbi:MAG: protein-glutamate O-methyltransferase CheR [Desulfobacterales bacterium]|nr:protein-glutamate O-methyltransferase CheR [Desulfobacterales bacterium]
MQLSYFISDSDFKTISSIVYDATGIVLKINKKNLVISRLIKRLNALGIPNFREYVDLLDDPLFFNKELPYIVNCLTTNTTNFFREPHQFEILKKILPSILEYGNKKNCHNLRIWSSACSTGEEPYTIAMVLSECMEYIRGWNVQILSTDIDSDVLSRASKGVYELERMKNVPQNYLNKYFNRVKTYHGEGYKISDNIRKMIIFRQVNLINDTFKFNSPVDIIFCRNVVIYFDDIGKQKLMNKFIEVLRSGGYFFLGHSETLLLYGKQFKFIESAVYQKA